MSNDLTALLAVPSVKEAKDRAFYVVLHGAGSANDALDAFAAAIVAAQDSQLAAQPEAETLQRAVEAARAVVACPPHSGEHEDVKVLRGCPRCAARVVEAAYPLLTAPLATKLAEAERERERKDTALEIIKGFEAREAALWATIEKLQGAEKGITSIELGGSQNDRKAWLQAYIALLAATRPDAAKGEG